MFSNNLMESVFSACTRPTMPLITMIMWGYLCSVMIIYGRGGDHVCVCVCHYIRQYIYVLRMLLMRFCMFRYYFTLSISQSLFLFSGWVLLPPFDRFPTHNHEYVHIISGLEVVRIYCWKFLPCRDGAAIDRWENRPTYWLQTRAFGVQKSMGQR